MRFARPRGRQQIPLASEPVRYPTGLRQRHRASRAVVCNGYTARVLKPSRFLGSGILAVQPYMMQRADEQHAIIRAVQRIANTNDMGWCDRLGLGDTARGQRVNPQLITVREAAGIEPAQQAEGDHIPFGVVRNIVCDYSDGPARYGAGFRCVGQSNCRTIPLGIVDVHNLSVGQTAAGLVDHAEPVLLADL